MCSATVRTDLLSRYRDDPAFRAAVRDPTTRMETLRQAGVSDSDQLQEVLAKIDWTIDDQQLLARVERDGVEW